MCQTRGPSGNMSIPHLNKSLQATAAAPFSFGGVENPLLSRFVGAQSPAAVPELPRWTA
jgi:hypothetical protein